MISTLYFSVTHVITAHSELLAITSPTIYDVLIALFGGLAGIIAMSIKRKGNVILSVLISTVIMPPIYTAGYGLATLQFNFSLVLCICLLLIRYLLLLLHFFVLVFVFSYSCRYSC